MLNLPDASAQWREYEFKGKPWGREPGALHRVAVPLEARLADVVRRHVAA